MNDNEIIDLFFARDPRQFRLQRKSMAAIAAMWQGIFCKTEWIRRNA